MEQQKKNWFRRHYILSGLFLLFIIGSFTELSGEKKQSGNIQTETQNTYAPDDIDLHIQAQEFVKQGLKAPSTAKFPVLPYQTSTDGDGLYRVVSHVDSQDSFGAMIRSDWSVTMRLVGERWILEKMAIGGEVVFNSVKENCVRDLALRNAEMIKKKMDSGVPFSEIDMVNQLSEYERQKSECYK
ncbi:MAG: hypothetical protein Q8P72_07115 [Candidatus Roizmanbacteria bacterium]|nr:hypothetical protein [Candidatus Roizmanbacteria bacterium]